MTNPLSKRLNFRIDETTYDAFEAKVSAANLTRSEFFRDIILNNRTQVKPEKSLELPGFKHNPVPNKEDLY